MEQFIVFAIFVVTLMALALFSTSKPRNNDVPPRDDVDDFWW